MARHAAGEHKALKAHSTPSEQPVNAASDDGVECKSSFVATEISAEKKSNDPTTASLCSPSRSKGGSLAPPSEAAPEQHGDCQLEHPAPMQFKRAPNNVPPIRDQALYNRLTHRSARNAVFSPGQCSDVDPEPAPDLDRD